MGSRKRCEDHLGNEYRSINELCRTYGISVGKYNYGMKSGLSIEEILNRGIVYDHLGKGYKNLSEMCKAYGIGLSVYMHRKKAGWSLKDILTREIKECSNGKRCRDHLGNEYSSVTEMCRAYGISRSLYINRIESGLSIEEALKTDRNASGRNLACTVYEDRNGNVYGSIESLCDALGIKIKAVNIIV